MYTVVRELTLPKELLYRMPPIGIAYLSTHFFVELIVERGLAPENFLLECLVFLALWFGLDGFIGLIFGNQAIAQILVRRQYLPAQILSFMVSLTVAALFFKWHSFPLELLAFIALWSAIDWGLSFLTKAWS